MPGSVGGAVCEGRPYPDIFSLEPDYPATLSRYPVSLVETGVSVNQFITENKHVSVLPE